MARKPAAARPLWRRALRRLGYAMAAVAVLALISFFIQPHDATQPNAPAKTTNVPAGYQPAHGLQCLDPANPTKPLPSGQTCPQNWALAKQHQIGTNNLALVTAAQSPGPKLWASAIKPTIVRYGAWAAGLALLLVAAWQLVRRRPPAGNPAHTLGARVGAAVLAATLAGIIGLFPAQAENVPNAPGGALVYVTSFDWLHTWVPTAGQRNLSTYIAEQEIYQPYADAVYRGGSNPPSRDAARAYAALVLQGQPVPSKDEATFNAYQDQTTHNSFLRLQIGRFALAYSVIKSVPSRLLALTVIGLRFLVPLLIIGSVGMLWLWGTSRAAIARLYFKVVIVAVLAFLIAGFLLTILNWWSVLLPMWTGTHLGGFGFGVSLSWFLNAVGMWLSSAALLLGMLTFIKHAIRFLSPGSSAPGQELVPFNR